MNFESLLEKAARGRWDEKRVNAWYDGIAWPVGANFLPSNAVNQLEMWQADSFDPETLDRELGWLSALGMNTMRVFLHDLLWKQDAKGFLARVDQFLGITEKHGIRPMFVFFDSCWNPFPVLGPQRAPTPHVHNSYWAQSPGAEIVTDPEAFAQLEGYVVGVLDYFRDDTRILAWDLWNEPGNINTTSFPIKDLTITRKHEIIVPLIAQTFGWARSVGVSQPLTAGVWEGDYTGDYANEAEMTALPKLELYASDIISFHTYSKLDKAVRQTEALKRYNRPIFCTEYMARGTGSTFQAILPYFKEMKVAAFNWGAVAGKSQTNYPWDSWEKPYTAEPELWHHDILRQDGTPYDKAEGEFLREILGAK